MELAGKRMGKSYKEMNQFMWNAFKNPNAHNALDDVENQIDKAIYMYKKVMEEYIF